jgi:hypothetical protein
VSTKHADTVHIVRHGRDDAEVHAPFEAKDLIKEALPRAWRRWDPEVKLWFIAADAVTELAAELRADGWHVVIRDAPRTGHHSKPSDTSTWADLMYQQLGKPLGDKAHRVLSRVLHPDAGGHLEAMKALNAARDRAHETARAA